MDEIVKGDDGYWRAIEQLENPVINHQNFIRRMNAINMTLFGDEYTIDTTKLVEKWLDDINEFTFYKSFEVYGDNIYETCICGFPIKNYYHAGRCNEKMILGCVCIENFFNDKIRYKLWKSKFKICSCCKRKNMYDKICAKCVRKNELEMINEQRKLANDKIQVERKAEEAKKKAEEDALKQKKIQYNIFRAEQIKKAENIVYDPEWYIIIEELKQAKIERNKLKS